MSSLFVFLASKGDREMGKLGRRRTERKEGRHAKKARGNRAFEKNSVKSMEFFLREWRMGGGFAGEKARPLPAEECYPILGGACSPSLETGLIRSPKKLDLLPYPTKAPARESVTESARLFTASEVGTRQAARKKTFSPGLRVCVPGLLDFFLRIGTL